MLAAQVHNKLTPHDATSFLLFTSALPIIQPQTTLCIPTQTELSDNRLRRMLARVEVNRFLMRNEVKPMLYNFEVEHGLVPPSTSVYSKVYVCVCVGCVCVCVWFVCVCVCVCVWFCVFVCMWCV